MMTLYAQRSVVRNLISLSRKGFIVVASYGALGHVPLDFQQYFLQLTSEPHKVYNGQLCLVLHSMQL